jgi:O-antigen/teichoic acid export membrane protein
MVAGNAVARPLWLVFLTVICIPILGDTGYGVLTASLALMTIALTIGDAGIVQYTTREVARSRGDAGRFFSNLLLVKVVLGLGAAIGGIGIGYVLGFRGLRLLALSLAGVYVLGLMVVEFSRAFFRAFEDFRWEAVSAITEKTALVGAGSVLLLTYRTPQATLGALAAVIVVLAVFHLVLVHRRFAAVSGGLLSGQFIRGSLIAAIPLGLAAQFSVIYFRTDSVMLEVMVGADVAGQYAGAYRVLDVVALGISLLTTVIFPRLSIHYAEKDIRPYRRLLTVSMGVTFAAAVVFALLVAYNGSLLMEVLKRGIGVAESTAILKVLAISIPIASANFVAVIALTAADDQLRLAVILGVAAVVNILVNLAWIPILGGQGAAWATVVTEALIFLALVWRFLSLFKRGGRLSVVD